MSKQWNDDEQPMRLDEGLTEDETEYCATCRPCCTLPHGAWSAATAAVATVAWLLSVLTMSSCHFMEAGFEYCEPVSPLFGTCGDCHCIVSPGDECPTGAENIPRVEYSVESTEMWKGLKHSNPLSLDCNPYKNTSCQTVPPQEYLELWEDAVCAVKYNYSSVADDDCPTEYSTISYPSLEAAEADGANITHYGSCGTCSSLQDLSVYVENPDLTGEGQACGLEGLNNLDAGIKCFEKIGYTYDCARMWMYNVHNTRDSCFQTCVDFTFEGDPNNGPPPQCEIAPCLLCDEEESGPFFKTVAGRARRRSGLLSKIARTCEELLIVNHTDPCTARAGDTPLLKEPEPFCHDISTEVGPLRYASVVSGLFLDLGFLNSRDTRITKSFYQECEPYDLKNVVRGFWVTTKELLGASYRVAKASSVIAFTLGTVILFLTWSTTCAAFKQNFWTAMACCYAICGICQLLVLTFYASDICPDGGCPVKEGTYFTIISGVFWFIAAALAWKTRGPAKPGQTIACCCCATFEANDRSGQMAPLISPSKAKAATHITVTETIQPDGSKVTEKITTQPDGSQVIETMTSTFANKSMAAEPGMAVVFTEEEEAPQDTPEAC